MLNAEKFVSDDLNAEDYPVAFTYSRLRLMTHGGLVQSVLAACDIGVTLSFRGLLFAMRG